jgi:hypothetical protein
MIMEGLEKALVELVHGSGVLVSWPSNWLEFWKWDLLDLA